MTLKNSNGEKLENEIYVKNNLFLNHAHTHYGKRGFQPVVKSILIPTKI